MIHNIFSRFFAHAECQIAGGDAGVREPSGSGRESVHEKQPGAGPERVPWAHLLLRRRLQQQ